MKVSLKIKENNTVETIQHEVEELNILQVTRSIKVIKDIFSLIQDDKNLQALLTEMFDGAQEVNEDENKQEEFGQRIIKSAIGAMDVLLMEIPEKALELLATLSNVKYDTLMQQKPEDVFDIYDAVIQVNDIDKLVKRAKKSLALTKAQTKIMNLFPKNEQTMEPTQA